MFFRGRRSRQIKTVARIALVFGLLSGASVCGQTVSDLSAKYPAVSAYEVRPGVLMTVRINRTRTLRFQQSWKVSLLTS
jgi:hypothetical protein